MLVLLDNATGTGYEAVVNLSTRSLARFDGLAQGVQPSIMLDEFNECEEAARKCPAFREAMKKRGIEDMSLVMIDAWSAGHYGNEPAEDKGKRLVRSLSWVRSEPMDNGYARPIEGVVTVIDLNRKEVVRVEDYGVVPLPPKAGNWGRSAIPTPPNRPQVAGRLTTRRAELHRERSRGPLAEVDASRGVQPPRGTGAQHGRL